MPGNQQTAVTKFIWRQNGHLKRENDSLSEAFLAAYRTHATLTELCSCGNLRENKLQNRGRYLFWRDFFDFVLKNIGLKQESRCNILDMLSIFFWKSRCSEPPLREIRYNMGAIRSFWTIFSLGQNCSHYNLQCLNIYDMFKLSEYCTRATCEMQHRASIARERGKISLFCFRPFDGITQS